MSRRQRLGRCVPRHYTHTHRFPFTTEYWRCRAARSVVLSFHISHDVVRCVADCDREAVR